MPQVLDKGSTYVDEICLALIRALQARCIPSSNPPIPENIEKYVIEVLDAELAGQIGDEQLSSEIRVDHALNVLRYYSNDMDALKSLAVSELKAGNYLIRQTNLEDVFLRATGRHLNDKQ